MVLGPNKEKFENRLGAERRRLAAPEEAIVLGPILAFCVVVIFCPKKEQVPEGKSKKSAHRKNKNRAN